jgi:hypothetical protein
VKDLITAHFRLMAIVFGCIYVLVAALVIIFGAYEGLMFLGVFTAAIAIFIGIFYAAYRAIFKEVVDNIPDIPQLTNPELLQRGQPAQAKILAVEDTGMTINEIYPAVRLTLEVYPPSGEPYEVTTNQLIERMQIPLFQPGEMVPVVINPDNKEEVHAFSPGGNAVVMESRADSEEAHQSEEMLIRIDEENKRILATGQQARAKVLQASDLGIRVNGPNPAMQFVLEVQPPGGEPFQAQTTGVIFEGSVSKFQPGKTIYVKYDPKDITRVSIYRSY